VDILQRCNECERNKGTISGICCDVNGLCLWFIGLWAYQCTVGPNTPQKNWHKALVTLRCTGQMICSKLLNNTFCLKKCVCVSVVSLTWHNLFISPWDSTKMRLGKNIVVHYIDSLKYFSRMYVVILYTGNMHFAFSECLNLNDL
jgi:hypothetical protein